MSAEHTTKKDSNVKEERQWSKLSISALEKVYSFLSHSDQFNMSLVCNSWMNVYEVPSLWRTYVFVFKESRSSKDSWNGTRFGWKYSQYFQHVKIDCSMPPNRNTWCRQLVAFLHHIISNSQLISVMFEGFVWSDSHTDDTERSDVNRAIGEFLGSQHHLKKLVLDGSYVKFGDFVELLNQLNENSKDTLLHLELKGLELCSSIEVEDRDLDAAQNLLSFAGLESLTALEIDYSLIFEKALNFFDIKNSQHSPRLALSTITFCYDNTDTSIAYYEGLKSIDWPFLLELYPHLQVKSIIMTNSPSRKEIENLISREIPITQLDYTYEESLDRPPSIDIDELINHLLVNNTSEDLVSLNLAWMKKVSNFDAIFLPLLQACKKLKSLELVVVSPNNGVGFLLEFFLENRSQTLKEVSIFIAGMNDKEYRTILVDSAENVLLLHTFGLNVKIYFQGAC